MDVIKTRVQATKGSVMESSFSKMFITLLKNEGVKSLFKGATMRMCVQAPMFSIMTTVSKLLYSQLLVLLLNYKSDGYLHNYLILVVFSCLHECVIVMYFCYCYVYYIFNLHMLY